MFSFIFLLYREISLFFLLVQFKDLHVVIAAKKNTKKEYRITFYGAKIFVLFLLDQIFYFADFDHLNKKNQSIIINMLIKKCPKYSPLKFKLC